MGQGVSECRLYDAPAKLSKVIKLGQLFLYYGPWEELVQKRGGRDVWATVLPPSFLSPSVVFPRKSDRPRRASSTNAGPISDGARARASPWLRLARCEKNGGANEHSYLANGADRPVPEPRGFCGPRIWPTRRLATTDKAKETTSVFNQWLSFFPVFENRTRS